MINFIKQYCHYLYWQLFSDQDGLCSSEASLQLQRPSRANGKVTAGIPMILKLSTGQGRGIEMKIPCLEGPANSVKMRYAL